MTETIKITIGGKDIENVLQEDREEIQKCVSELEHKITELETEIATNPMKTTEEMSKQIADLETLGKAKNLQNDINDYAGKNNL